MMEHSTCLEYPQAPGHCGIMHANILMMNFEGLPVVSLITCMDGM